ncbi:hypothetical protein [uncultured Haemophilus sp.]|uniref:hypothetical protein n=1 Tax=uncultured Haemophilus sp. TaxID=237779 RepID=UPI0025F9C00D|nr:hypothetical protein [uncultured Haemophilus sp.]
MTLFEESVEAISDDFSILIEKKVINIFYKYPFEYGNIDKLSEKAKRAAYQLFRFLR